MGKLNWSALLLVAFGGLLLVIAWEGTHRKFWAAVTGQPQSPPSTPGAPQSGGPLLASGDFGQQSWQQPPVNPTGQQINQRVCRDNPNAPACKQLAGGGANF